MINCLTNKLIQLPFNYHYAYRFFKQSPHKPISTHFPPLPWSPPPAQQPAFSLFSPFLAVLWHHHHRSPTAGVELSSSRKNSRLGIRMYLGFLFKCFLLQGSIFIPTVTSSALDRFHHLSRYKHFMYSYRQVPWRQHGWHGQPLRRTAFAWLCNTACLGTNGKAEMRRQQ